MSNELEKRFSTYLSKTLKGYSNRQKIKYFKTMNVETNLTEENIEKVSLMDNSLMQKQKLEEIDVDCKHLEQAFSNYKYYKAMKKVPIEQKQALYLLVVEEFTLQEVSQILKTTPNNVNKLKQKAISNFKKNLEELKK